MLTSLVRLAQGATPVGALGAGGSTAVARVRRLATPGQPLPWRTRLAAASGMLILAATPLILAATPAAVASATYWPVSLPA